MSGEETLAQVYREVESPKLPNFKKAAFIVFVYSLVLTAGISFLAVLLIPDELRMKDYSDNLIGGLAMHVDRAAAWPGCCLNAFVVVVGFLILAGAVNTAIIGSNGVLNRVAEDGVLPDWFLKPHSPLRHHLPHALPDRRPATARRSSSAAATCTCWARPTPSAWSGVSSSRPWRWWCCDSRTAAPREFKVPLELCIGGVEVPIGLSSIFLVLLVTAILNLLTKEVATIGGLAFTAVFLTVFMVSEHYHEKQRGGGGTTSTSNSSTSERPRKSTPRPSGPDQALSQAGGHPLARRTSSCWKRPWPRPTPKRPTWS